MQSHKKQFEDQNIKNKILNSEFTVKCESMNNVLCAQ